ncbi:MAG: hypothetical protein XD60_0439 [Acetothermia bacterium 64_32]|nr:MAG: hypothetical protein XD60_0439 [Acetothermia bacterium 64_32]MBC7098818.1 hypothetical protein [Candidatus Bipolaricaulota bacterium]HAF70996.1 hypothetical protein [Candidatus Acetothermia bacterium]
MAEQRERPVAAFVLSLLAGLWMIFAAGGVISGYNPAWRWGWRMGRMMGSGWTWGREVADWWPWLGVLIGIVVLVGAGMLYAKPRQASGWGITILVASALSFFLGMGGPLPSILGVSGGAVALAWKGET